MLQAGRLRALVTETLLASSCLQGWTLVALQTLFASICNQHWPCINLCALRVRASLS